MNSFRDIKLIAFDFWGVFAQMKPPMDEFLLKHNISPFDHMDVTHEFIVEHDLDKINEEEFLEKCSKVFKIKIPYPECKYHYHEGCLNQDLISIIKKLKSKYKIALITNNNREYCQEFIFSSGLDKLFDELILSYEVGYRKPDPKIYQILIDKSHFKPEEILFLDDDPSKFPNAEKLGIQTLVYKGAETNKILLDLL